MNYRPIDDEEFAAYWALDGAAFREQYRRERYTPEVRERLRGFFAPHGLVAQLELLPFELQLGPKQSAAALGIGGVAVDPGQRRRGYAAQLLRAALAEIAERGVAFCLLHAFKHSFYARYGWAPLCERRIYSGEPALFRAFRPSAGRFALLGDADADLLLLDGVYRQALQGRFGPLLRSPRWWHDDVLRSPNGARAFAYLWRDEADQPRSYMIFRYDSGGKHGRERLVCREIVAADPLARAQLFAFLADQDSQVEEIRFAAPADAPVNLLFPDPLSCQVEPYGMLRLVDVAAALVAYPFGPNAHGELRLRISDEWLPANQAVYRLQIANGRAEVERLPFEAPADLSCSVALLAQLVSRVVRPRTAAAFGLLEVHDRAALTLAEQAFAGLAPFLSDFF